ncbi:MAG: ATP-dependent helicase [Naasia sp.]|jgi:DNA helicase-2/ATP-dependent DNA helicase PcrA|uniref:ATP-dependent helicase n=1 Tax=Naasia sp. TaxID=2546198 RepID=UPI002636B45B|nr:ATP-dependent helicase [Naasia sp.]MCU1570832.1 ATP-dependent helicase [Naasia sp.]
MTAEDLLAGLDPEQRKAAETLLGPVCLLAGAGTGKTRAITHRIAYGVASGVYPPGRVMALTFTTRAAGELRSRLRALGAAGVQARTFHSAALSQLSYFWPQVVGGTLPRVLDSKARLLAQAAESVHVNVDTAALRDIAAEIEWRKVSGVSLDEYERRAETRPLPNGVDAPRAVAIQRAYEELKDARRQLDFEDVLLATIGMIEEEPRVAQHVREQYRFFVVDEYQDVSPLQNQLLAAWMGDHRDLCVVGDASQTIYSFAGAKADYLLDFGARHPDAEVIRLERNYRSVPAVIAVANRLMRDRPGALTLLPAGAEGPPMSDASSVELAGYPTEPAEARSIADAIAERIAAGERPRDIAVLYRINSQSAGFETALAERDVAYTVRGSARFFERREVKEALMMLRAAALTQSQDPLFKTVSDVLRSLGWSQQPPETRGAVRERWDSLDTLMSLAEEAEAGTTLPQFVEDLAERQAAQHEPTVDAVTLATFHSAKGLEWDTVYLAGVSEGYLPIGYARTPEAVEEERRLLYVGITRARSTLRLSWAAVGPHRAAPRERSRFLTELGTSIPDAAARVLA